jgi:hypothetical protein
MVAILGIERACMEIPAVTTPRAALDQIPLSRYALHRPHHSSATPTRVTTTSLARLGIRQQLSESPADLAAHPSEDEERKKWYRRNDL